MRKRRFQEAEQHLQVPVVSMWQVMDGPPDASCQVMPIALDEESQQTKEIGEEYAQDGLGGAKSIHGEQENMRKLTRG